MLPPDSRFVWCADIQARQRKPLYVDLVHYSGALSRAIAECISDAMTVRRLLPILN